MRAHRYRWLILLTAIAAFVILVVFGIRKTGGRGIVISFTGYTNLPNNSTRFALFSVRNDDFLAVRWRGNWVEVEGLPYNKAPVVNLSLPWFTGMTLGKGDALALAVGEPSEEGRWRFSVLSSRYVLQEWALDFSIRHKLPTGFGRFSWINAQRILNPTNFITNSSPWLTK